MLRNGSDSLEVIMTPIAKMSGSKAEKNRNGATVTAFVL
jgi:hypothetical protein